MRVKVVIRSPQTGSEERHLISVPEHLKYISDLQFHMTGKLGLESYLAKSRDSIALTIDGYNLPKKEKISELIKNDDLINVQFLGSKRRNERLFDHADEASNEVQQDSQFLSLIRDVNLLKNLYSKAKRTKVDNKDFEYNELENPFAEEPKQHNVNRRRSIVDNNRGGQKVNKEESGEVVQVVVKEHRHKHRSHMDVESETESEGEAPHIIVTKQTQQQKNAISQAGKKTTSEIKPEKIEHLLGEQTHRPKPKLISKPISKKDQWRVESSSSDESPVETKKASRIKPEKIKSLLGEETHRSKPKLISKPQTKTKQVESEEESSEEEKEEEKTIIKEKKIVTTLNIPTPADAFNKKKETWDKLPVATQWGAKQKEKKEAKANKQAGRQQQEEKSIDKIPTEAPQQLTSTHLKGQAAQNSSKNNEKVQPSISQAQQAAKPQQTSSTANSQKPKPQTSQTNQSNQSQVQTAQKKGQTSRPNKQESSAASNNTVYYGYDEIYHEPYYKKAVYDPDIFHLNFDAGKTSSGKTNFNGYVQISVSKLEEKWKKESVMLLKVDDLIKYKCTTLSMTAMEPILSDWRTGKIEGITKNKVSIRRSDVQPRPDKEPGEEDDEEEETDEDEFFLHTLNSLYISEKSLDQERKNTIQALLQEEKTAAKKEKEDFVEKKKQLQEELQKQIKKSEEEAIKDKDDYKRRMVGKQVNYYYSDKNYQKDAFIKAHSEKDPERYMPINLLLNFPKIQNMTKDVNVVIEGMKYVIATDPECNYELDESGTKVKKRIL